MMKIIIHWNEYKRIKIAEPRQKNQNRGAKIEEPNKTEEPK